MGLVLFAIASIFLWAVLHGGTWRDNNDET